MGKIGDEPQTDKHILEELNAIRSLLEDLVYESSGDGIEPLKLKHVKLHSPLFFGGKSFGMDLYPARDKHIELSYNPKSQIVFVKWSPQGAPSELAWVPLSNIASMVQAHGPIVAEAPQHTAQAIGSPDEVVRVAQVETPYGHVHAGPGHGKTK